MKSETISVTKKTHSVPQAKTKVWISTEVADGFKSEMVNQIPTPVSAPNTMVRSRKNLVCFLT